jgi:hypothetical protein
MYMCIMLLLNFDSVFLESKRLDLMNAINECMYDVAHETSQDASIGTI